MTFASFPQCPMAINWRFLNFAITTATILAITRLLFSRDTATIFALSGGFQTAIPNPYLLLR